MGIRERIVLLVFTLFNIISNNFIPFYSDETYYWIWSKKLALSYFDHPPMVAYLIKATTLFGDSPMEIRLGAPLMMAGSAYLLYKLATKMFDEKTAIYTFYIFLSAIIVQGGYTIIAPDIPLIFFWTITLYAAYLYIEEGERNYALLTGIFAGAVLLSKYTGVLVLVSIVLYILLYKRSLFKDRYFYYALLLCFAVFSPVIYWNYTHDFLSFKFQLGHGIAEEKIFRPDEFFKFAGTQLLLFHPLYLIPLFYFMVRDREIFSRKKMFLLIPFLFPLLFFIYFAASKKANAQWAVPAYLSASILLGYYLSQRNARKLIIVAAIVTAVLMLLVKTPLGNYLEPIKNFQARAGKIDNFKQEIDALNVDIERYDFIIIDDYHGTDVAYYFKKYDNVLVLAPARFSNFNIWRYEDLGIPMESPLHTLPRLGKCLYIGISDKHIYELNQLFGEGEILMWEKKKIGARERVLYFVEYQN